MKRHGLYTTAISLISSLMFIACSDGGDSSMNVVPAPTSVSSSSLISSSSDFVYSEMNNSVSSSSDEDSSSSVEVASSSSENAISSSAGTDQPTFSKYISQFAAPGESSVSFDSHVLAINAGALSLKCEENVISYVGEEELLVPLNAISEENIAECFPKTAPLLSKKFASEMENMKFYAVIVQLGDNPTFAVLNKFAADEININVVYPGGNCILDTWGPLVMYLVADTEGFVQEENIPITSEVIRSEIWKCDESGRNTPNVKSGGEWFSDSLL